MVAFAMLILAGQLKRLIASMHDEINEMALLSAILNSPDEPIA